MTLELLDRPTTTILAGFTPPNPHGEPQPDEAEETSPEEEEKG